MENIKKFVFVFLLTGIAFASGKVFADSEDLKNTQTFKKSQEETKAFDIEKNSHSKSDFKTRRGLKKNLREIKEDPSYKTTYVTMGGLGVLTKNSYLVAPSINGGWLFREDKKGVDVNLSSAYLFKNKDRVFSLTLPKVQYLTFLTDVKSNAKHSGYFGFGGSFYNLFVSKKEKKTEVNEYTDETYSYNREKVVSGYSGLAASATVGYNYKLGKNLQSYLQVGANMPTPLSIYARGDIYKPTFEVNVGLGF